MPFLIIQEGGGTKHPLNHPLHERQIKYVKMAIRIYCLVTQMHFKKSAFVHHLAKRKLMVNFTTLFANSRNWRNENFDQTSGHDK